MIGKLMKNCQCWSFYTIELVVRYKAEAWPTAEIEPPLKPGNCFMFSESTRYILFNGGVLNPINSNSNSIRDTIKKQFVSSFLFVKDNSSLYTVASERRNFHQHKYLHCH